MLGQCQAWEWPDSAVFREETMSLLKIASMGHPILRRVARPIEDPTDPEVRRLALDMVETMIDAGGIGLAAPQVYTGARLIVFSTIEERPDGDGPPPETITMLLNPTVVALDDSQDEAFEGCLSIPGIRGLVPRPGRIGYSGWDLDGRRIEREARGLHARVVQHEVDHLDGVLYLDRMRDFATLAFESELHHVMPRKE